MGDDTEIEMEPMDLSRPAASADTDRARASQLRAALLEKVEGTAAGLGNEDTHGEELAAAKAQLRAAQEVLALRASEATAVMNAREDRLARAEAAEARGDLAEATELREAAALADAQFRGYVTTVTQEKARVDGLTADVGRLEAWSDAAEARSVSAVNALSAAEREIDDLEQRADRLTRAELHDRTARLYTDEAARLEAEGHVSEAQALWDAANAELGRAEAARHEAAAFEVDESALRAAELEPVPEGVDPVLDADAAGPAGVEPSGADAPILDTSTSDAASPETPAFESPAFESPTFEEPATEAAHDFAEPPVEDVGDLGFDEVTVTDEL